MNYLHYLYHFLVVAYTVIRCWVGRHEWVRRYHYRQCNRCGEWNMKRMWIDAG